MQWIRLRDRRLSAEGKACTRLCHEGWYYLLVLAFVISGSVLREINLLVVMAGMMVGPLLINWRIVVRGMRGITVHRELPAVLAAGDLLEVQLRVEKAARPAQRRPRKTTGLVVEDRIERLNSSAPPVFPKAMPWQIRSGEERTICYRARLTERGRYRFGPLTAATRYPIGLVRRTLGLGQVQELTVFPRMGQLSPRWRHVLQQTFRGERFSQVRPGGAQGEFHRLREWRSGDSLRWVHWRTSARLGQPVVREFEQPGEPNYAILLDLVPSQELAHIESEPVETAISFSATLLNEICCEAGTRSLTLAVDHEGQQFRSGAVSRHLLRELLELLAGVEPRQEDNLESLLAALLDRLDIGTNLVVVTTRSAAITARLEAAVKLGGARHRRLAERMSVVDVTEERLSDLFRIDAAPEAATDDAIESTGEVVAS